MSSAYIVIIACILLSALLSGMEIAFNSANRLKIAVDKSKHTIISKQISHFLQKPANFITAILLGNNIALVIYGIYAENILTPVLRSIPITFFQSSFMIFLMQTIIATLVILVLAEFLPKIIFRKRSNRLLFFFALPLSIIYYILYPLVFIFTKMSRFILFKKAKQIPDNVATSFTSEDIYYLIEEFSSEKNKDLENNQEMIMAQHVIDLKHLKVRECMRPRAEVVAADIDDNVEEVKQKLIETGLSKIIIYKDSIDNTLGYVHALDFFKNPENISQILKKTITVPETMRADSLLRYFIANNKSIVIVVDEYGGTSGIVTLEDVMEEIFGEIYDEFDDTQAIIEQKNDDGSFNFSARLEIDYLNEKYDLGLPVSDSYETLGGLLMQAKGDIPNEADEITVGNCKFTILKASDNKVEEVRLGNIG
jgi:CBS domain containing-hemolysin-like protein